MIYVIRITKNYEYNSFSTNYDRAYSKLSSAQEKVKDLSKTIFDMNLDENYLLEDVTYEIDEIELED